ncbi:hypothetical protein E2C01_039956 [Portunus trituberculatus]|uniref:Uncharacterized protein n=1 Tax=Portunus trituberculatus TaxID=210409 RepID=A0A5B7FIC8_PORTR|nr:hypothetical protein [Portunus trituberculatus]
MVLRFRLVYDENFPSNRCYVTFLSCDEACLALQHVAYLPLAGSGFKTEFLHSRNISDNDIDYIPNLFDNHLEVSIPEIRQIPPPRCSDGYCRTCCDTVCDEEALDIKSSNNVVTAVLRGPTVAKSAVRPDPRPPVPGTS